ncbi:MAG: nucleotidyltransferase domain-containing protein [Treponema sp.]|nr:nucleotidyltransferase domain-containing protein [Treponema sp.]
MQALETVGFQGLQKRHILPERYAKSGKFFKNLKKRLKYLEKSYKILYMEVINIPQKYQNDVELAVNYLKSEGCSAIYLFGSIVTGKTHDESDIDIGVKGLSPKKFIRTYSILNNKLLNRIDLVDFDINNSFFELLNSLGEVKKIG